MKQGPIQHKQGPIQTVANGQESSRESRQLRTIKITAGNSRLLGQLLTVGNIADMFVIVYSVRYDVLNVLPHDEGLPFRQRTW